MRLLPLMVQVDPNGGLPCQLALSRTVLEGRLSRITTSVAAPPSLETQRAVEQFLYHQAELLDTKRWREFIDLFAADGVYWVPAQPEHTSGEGVPSVFYENRDLMTVRMNRMLHPHAWSQKT